MIKIILILDTILSLITAGMVDWVNTDYSYLYNNNAVVEELNNHTLREVFEDGNEITNYLTGWNTYSNNTQSILDDTLILLKTVSTGNIGLIKDLDLIQNNYLYIRVSYASDDNSNAYLYLGSTTSGVSAYTIDTTSIKKMVVGTDQNIYFVNFSKPVDFQMYISYFMVIDLTSLGIDTLTVEQMDNYYEIYQNNLEREMQMDYTINELDINDLIVIILWSGLWYVVFRFVKWGVRI